MKAIDSTITVNSLFQTDVCVSYIKISRMSCEQMVAFLLEQISLVSFLPLLLHLPSFFCVCQFQLEHYEEKMFCQSNAGIPAMFHGTDSLFVASVSLAGSRPSQSPPLPSCSQLLLRVQGQQLLSVPAGRDRLRLLLR